MRIPCPICGARDLGEFTVLGAARPRPAFSAEAPDPETLDGAAARAAFAAHVYERDNPAGVQEEYWFHGLGCQAWLVVTRDSRSHAVHGARLASAVKA